MQKSLLRLFKAYYGKESDDISQTALKYGILLVGKSDYDICQDAIELYGKDKEKWNQTFHKSFETVNSATNEELVTQQIVHYITTYGFEKLGIYSKDKVYIPKEELDIPDLDVDKIELLVIRPISGKEISKRIMKLITSGIALSREMIDDIMELCDFIDIKKVEQISNRELRIRLYEKYTIVPSDPDEFLRYVIYSLTSETLKIKNDYLYKKINQGYKEEAYFLFRDYLDENEDGYKKLASIFFRNKKLFLAFKTSKRNNDYELTEKEKALNKYINKIRKLADENKKTLKKDVVDMLTQDVDIEDDEIISALDKITIFRQIRVLNGIAYRIHGKNDIIYKIRNGSIYATKIKRRAPKLIKKLEQRYDIVKKHLVSRVSKLVKGKKVYIPENVSYTVPSSQKQFIGNYPEGSYIETPLDSDMVYGIHWKNLKIADELMKNKYYLSEDDENSNKEIRVDLDLKQISQNQIFGWDARYKTNDGKIIFSGDMTDAQLPNGATELFYISKDLREDIISGQDKVKEAKDLLRTKKYSRMVMETKYPVESKETFSFIKEMQTKLKNTDSYMIGNSLVAYEISNSFQKELNLITILTIAFIFVVVMITFKSVLIPGILVFLIQTAVYMTMSILTLEGGSVYFIALLIVQSILMGATIDYAILYTTYYLEARKQMTVKESLISAYNKSIHTILTSSLILMLVTLVVGHFGSAITAKICITISQGTLCSTLLILFILPELIAIFDRLINKKKKIAKNG